MERLRYQALSYKRRNLDCFTNQSNMLYRLWRLVGNGQKSTIYVTSRKDFVTGTKTINLPKHLGKITPLGLGKGPVRPPPATVVDDDPKALGRERPERGIPRQRHRNTIATPSFRRRCVSAS